MSRAVAYLKAERSGRAAETAALLLLLMKGYWPLVRRMKTPRGEIDLIMRRGRTLVLVEVKRRADFEQGLQAVGTRQQQRMLNAFSWWLARNPHYIRCTVRCDAVLSAPYRMPHHIKNAFWA